MKTNPDGSALSGETIAEMMNERFSREEFPYLSDIMGSDWGSNFPYGPLSASEYRDRAFETASRIYSDEAGHLWANEGGNPSY